MSSDLKRRLAIFLGIVVLAILFLVPSFFRDDFKNRAWLSKPLSLGLDLRGGAHLVYQVETAEAVKSRLQSKGNAIRSELREAKVPVLRTKVNEDTQLEIQLLSDKSEEKAKALVQDEYKDLKFVAGRKEAGGRETLVYSLGESDIEKIKAESVNQSIETLRNRVDQFGVAEPLIQRSGADRINLQMPGVTDIDSVKKIVGSVAKLEFKLLATEGQSADTVTLKDRKGDPVIVHDDALMTGDAVGDARMSVANGQVEVSLSLTTEGGKLFRKITTDNVGKNLSIILDNVVYSSPVIREPISGGKASISGGFSVEEAKQLAVVLRSGALPAPLKVLEERTVGPNLGAESIRKGIIAIIVGFVWIVVFLIVYYKKSGVVAIGSLLFNLLFLVALLAAFGATLTLPGLAGLALTIGMAVDSNVIIFERIKEEVRRGSSRDGSVSAGFERALSAIVDSNIATALSAVVLYIAGTGPIRGFAVTLFVGIITTLYCATSVCRLAFDIFKIESKKGLSI